MNNQKDIDSSLNQKEINDYLPQLIVWEDFINLRKQDRETWKYTELLNWNYKIVDFDINYGYITIKYDNLVKSFDFDIENENLCINEYFIREWIWNSKYENYFILERN